MKKLYHNGTIYTMERPDDTYAGVIVENGLIEAVLSKEDLNQIQTTDYETIDLKGGTMFPGFVETHIHVMGTGVWLSSVILNGETNIGNVKEKLARKHKRYNQVNG